LRALHVLSGLDPKLGGPPVAVRNIVVAASRQGVDVELAACDVGGEHVGQMAAELRRESATLRPFPITGRSEPLVRWGVSGPMLAYLYRRIPSFDIVHIHGAWSLTSLAGGVRARIAGVPSVLTPHETLTDFDIDVSRSRMRTWQKRIIGGLLVRLIDVVVFSSEIERRDSPIARAAEARVLPHPMVDERSQRPPNAPSSDQLRVGFLGRLHSKKNLPALLEAVSRCPGVELAVAGSGPEEAAYRERARSLGLDSRVEWLGFLAGTAKRDFLHAIDVLAMPSLYECFGVSAVEAMQAGVPVIVSDTVGVAAAVSGYEAGIVAGRDTESLAAAITRLRDEPALRARCGCGASQAAREEFSFATFGRGIERIYSELAIRRSREPARLRGGRTRP
jgi:glycosyltransferase involved in cell wall biosynthesis